MQFIVRLQLRYFILLFLVWLYNPTKILSQNSGNKRTIVHVKFKEEFIPKNSVTGQSFRSGNERMDQVSEKYQAVSLRRIFPPAGIFEEAHKSYGLHQWYEIEFNSNTDIKRVVAEYSSLSLFYSVEECKAYTHGDTNGKISQPILPSGANDTWFSRQWHFSNTGQSGGTPGADINLMKAWQVQTGSPNVIVAVIDGGIDITHDDIKDALWVNADEIPGNSIDDDHNGYVDDIHGYGFGDQSSTIAPDVHGTHVAGVIGALSNNGFGVSGIAGGSGSGDGVRLMSCAAFGGFKVGGFEQAMVYAADNGAVIAQNSWGGGSRAIEAAIDYFVSRAGYDNTSANFNLNIQTGPMAGGLVIFAAGNSSTSDPNYGYPGSYKNAIAVASTDHNDLKSYFSNFGDWVDISAPGSDVYSTITDDGYGFLSGTSMACPHVSGVAALVLSHIQRKGLKSAEVWNRLKFSARSLTLKNPTLKGLLGSGRLDAFIALREPDAIPPSPIQDLRTTEVHNSSITITWTATGENGSEGQASEYEIRYSTTPINDSNFASASLIPSPLPPISGEAVVLEVKNLQSNTTYFFAMKSKDMYYNESGLSNVLSVRTLISPTLQVITPSLEQQLFTGGVSVKQIQVRNAGEEDELIVRLGIPKIEDAPVGLSLGAKGRLFAINAGKNTIEELNLKTGAVLNSINMPEPSSKLAEGLAFDGAHVYYGRTSNIYKINVQSGKVVQVISLSTVTAIRGLAWSGQYLYASVDVFYNGVYAANLYKVDVDTGEIVSATNYMAGELTFFATRNTLIGVNSHAVIEYDQNTGLPIRELYSGYYPSGLGYSEVSKLLFIAEGNVIKAFNVTSGKIEYSFPYSPTTAIASDEFKIGWLESADEVVKIAAGATANLPVYFKATDLNTGQWTGKIKVYPVNVNAPAKEVPVKMTVTGASEIEVTSKLDLKEKFIGFVIDTVITIENRGYADLVVSSITVKDARIALSISSITLPRNQKVDLKITISPQNEGVIESAIEIVSNDLDEGNLSIPVRVNVLNAPGILLNPSSLSTTLSSGETKTLSFTATNAGGSKLYWNTNIVGLSAPIQNQPKRKDPSDPVQAAEPSEVNEFSILAPSPEPITCLSHDPKSGMIYAKSLAGNKFYRYDPVANNWTQIGVTPGTFTGQAAYLDGKIYFGGTELNIYNIQNNSWSSIPFPSPVEANNLTSDGQYVYITLELVHIDFIGTYSTFYRFDPVSEKWLRLADTPYSNYQYNEGGMSYHSGVIYVHPSPSESFFGDGNTPFFKYSISTNSWLSTDQILGKAYTGSAIDPALRKYYVLGSSPVSAKVIMSIRDLTYGDWTRKQIPFTPEGGTNIIFVGKSGGSGIYISKGYGGTGFVRYNTEPAAEWISISPSSGILNPGETQTLTVNVNAKGQDGGMYDGAIRVYSNNPKIEKQIPFSISVVGAPDMLISKTNFDLGSVESSRSWGESFIIKNVGTAPLVLSNVTSDDLSLSISKSNFSLPTGEQLLLFVYVNKPQIGDFRGVLTLHSNDPDQGSLELSVKYRGVYSPEFKMTPNEISVQLLTGAKYVETLVVENVGLGETTKDYFVVDDGRLGWMTARLDGPLEPRGVKSTQVILDAARKEEGVYKGKLQVWYYGEPRAEIPVQMIVKAATDISTSFEKLDFGNRFINNSYDSALQITNNGVYPLNISSISSNNPSMTISPSLPATLQPGESISAIIRLEVSSLGSKFGEITILSDDPDESTYIIPIMANGVNPPILSSKEQIDETINSNETKTISLALNNIGGSELRWALETKSLPIEESNISLKAVSEYALMAPVIDPGSGSLYAHSLHYQNLYKYNTIGNYWNTIGTIDFPRVSDTVGGAVIMDSKMYCTYPVEANKIYVYDMGVSQWSTVPSELGFGTATITSDGVLLYLAGGGRFKSFNPKTKQWTNLPIPTINLDGMGGLSYFNGSVYAHEGNGLGFARYTIATGKWETLASLPDHAVLGSAIDPTKKRYFAYGKNERNDNFIYEYDFGANYWYVRPFDQFEVSDGGMVYLPSIDFEGVYFIQGTMGNKFAKYTPSQELPWMRVGSFYGATQAAASSTIAVNLNAYKLNTGVYQGSIMVSSNDPVNPVLTIPVKLNVTNPGPIIDAPKEIQGVLEKSVTSQVALKIENKSSKSLQWSFSGALPAWLSADAFSGVIPGNSFQNVTLMISPASYSPSKIDYRLDIGSNDPLNSVVSTQLKFDINNSPVVLKPIPSQSLTTKELVLGLNTYFSDPDNDVLYFSATSENTISATVTVEGSNLTIKPAKTGTSVVKVKAVDKYGFSVETQFNVDVDDLITGVEPGQTDILQIIPNPTRKEFICRYETDDPGLARVLIVDMAGRTIISSDEFQEVFGTNEYYSDATLLAPGLYILKLMRNGNSVQTTKVIKY